MLEIKAVQGNLPLVFVLGYGLTHVNTQVQGTEEIHGSEATEKETESLFSKPTLTL